MISKLDLIKNYLVEADNRQFLKKLIELNGSSIIDTIYIDPPYNKNASVSIYKNNYKEDEWTELMKNTLNSAKILLKNEGVIYISIDDHELYHLKFICDEIFGSKNFISNLIVINNPQGRNGSSFFRQTHEYCLVYAKNKKECKITSLLTNDVEEVYRGPLLKATGKKDKTREARPNCFYPVLFKDDKLFMIELNEYKNLYNSSENKFNDEFLNKIIFKYEGEGYDVILPYTDYRTKELGRWRFDYARFKEAIVKDEIIFSKNSHGITLNKKLYRMSRQKPKTIFDKTAYSTTSGMKALRDLIGLNNFDYPKAPEFIKDLIEINCPQDGVVLDFFAGSGTTAEAVLRSNKEFNCNRKFIICSLNENNLFYDVTKKRLDALKDKYNEDYKLLKI